jgi:Flp pilus assembly protein TadG
MKLLKKEDGNVLVLSAVCMTGILGAMALAIDVGCVHYQQTRLQTAADSAAIAAGLELGNCSNTICTNMVTAAENALIEDGITSATIAPAKNQCSVSNSTGLAMIINLAPCVLGTSDPNNGNTHMVEVVLTAPQNTFFGRIVGISTLHLAARAEAGDAYINTSGGGNCVWTNGLAFNSSNGVFDLVNCGLYDNGNLQTNNGDGVTASSFLYYGTWSPNNCNNSCKWTLGSSQTLPTHTTTQQSDPLASLTPPTKPSASSTASSTTPNSGTTLQPGYYANDVNLNSNVAVNLAPGLYYMNGSFNVNSGASLTCTGCTGGLGVTLYFSSGTLQMNSNSAVQLTAPSAGSTSNGDVANMLLWYDKNNGSGLTIDTGSTSYFNGVIYLPSQTLTLNSGSGVTINNGATATALDVKNMIVNDSEKFVVNGGSLLGAGSTQTLGKFALAE